jgi:hypothetical protein
MVASWIDAWITIHSQTNIFNYCAETQLLCFGTIFEKYRLRFLSIVRAETQLHRNGPHGGVTQIGPLRCSWVFAISLARYR